jgi:hypothetical protein
MQLDERLPAARQPVFLLLIDRAPESMTLRYLKSTVLTKNEGARKHHKLPK